MRRRSGARAGAARHRGKTFYVTEKLDGTSFTAFLRQGQFGICSRNLWMDETDETSILVRVARPEAGREAAERSVRTRGTTWRSRPR